MRIFFIALCAACELHAFPSSLFWTVCTTDVQDTGNMHSELDTYFELFHENDPHPFLPIDVGFTLGLFSYNKIKGEVGLDLVSSGDGSPLFFNGKIGMEEGKLFKKAPSISTGIYFVGTRPQRTTFNVYHAEIGKKLPWEGGRFFAGYYRGTRALLRDRNGFMLGFEQKFCPAKDCEGTDYYRFVFNADYASGKNVVGGGGVCLYYYFTPRIYIQTGPTFFNDTEVYGKWKWSILANFDFEFFGGCKSEEKSSSKKSKTPNESNPKSEEKS